MTSCFSIYGPYGGVTLPQQFRWSFVQSILRIVLVVYWCPWWRQASKLAESFVQCAGRRGRGRSERYTISLQWRHQLWGGGAHDPSISNNLFFSVHLDLNSNSNLYGYLSKHFTVCSLVVAIHENILCHLLCHFHLGRVLCPLTPNPGEPLVQLLYK